MKKIIIPPFVLALVLLAVFFGRSVYSQTSSKGQVMFVLDASSSMLVKDGSGRARIDTAKDALSSALASIPADVAVGLRAYGSTVPDTNKADGCKDSQLITAPALNNGAAIKAAIPGIQAKGWTPIGYSLEQVAKDFKGEGPKSVILLSDGVDTCAPPDPCEVARNIAGQGVKIKVNTLGLAVDNVARAQLECIAKATGGDYFDVNSLDRLEGTLTAVTAREANLFKATGIPVKGNPRIEDAPVILPNTNYTDDILPGEERYYAFEALPKQKIQVLVRAEDNDDTFGVVDSLAMDLYRVKNVERQGVVSDVKLFTSRGVENLTTEKTIPAEITQPELFAIKLKFNSKKTGNVLPLEIRLTTEGGEAPANTATTDGSAKGDAQSAKNSFLLILGVILAVAAAAFYHLLRKKNRQAATSANPPEQPPMPPSSSDQNISQTP